MKEYTFNKIVNIAKLTQELRFAGFNTPGVAYNGQDSNPILTVLLDDSETKDPSVIVAGHIGTPSKQTSIEDRIKILETKAGVVADV